MSKMDNIFRNKLANSKEAHPEHLWKAIESELEGENKRPMGWMFISSALILLTAIFSFWYFNDSRSIEKSNRIADSQDIQQGVSLENESLSKTSAYNSSAKQSIQLATNENDQSKEFNNHSKNQKVKEEQKNANTAQNAKLLKTNSIIENNNSTNDLGASDLLVSATDKVNLLINDNSSIIENATSSESNINNTNNTVQGTQQLKGNQKQVQSSNNNTLGAGDHSEIKWKIETTDNVIVNTISAPQIIQRKAFDRRRELFRAPFEIASRVEINKVIAESTRLKDLNALSNLLYIDCPTFSSDRTGMHLDLYMNHEMPFQSLSAKEGGSQLLNLRQDSESSQYSHSFGGRISLVLPSGLSLRTGFNYSKINQSVSYADETGLELTSDNSHQLVEIPFLLGYEFGQEGSRFYYTANAGVLLNVRYTQEGNIISEDLVLTPVASAVDGKSAYSDSAGASLFGSFAVYYRWLNRFDLYLEPNIRFMPGSLTNEAYSIDEKFTTVGVMTGIRYRF